VLTAGSLRLASRAASRLGARDPEPAAHGASGEAGGHRHDPDALMRVAPRRSAAAEAKLEEPRAAGGARDVGVHSVGAASGSKAVASQSRLLALTPVALAP